MQKYNRRNVFLIVLLTAALALPTHAQEKSFSVSFKSNFTVSSRLFYNIDGPDEFARSQYIGIDDIFGFGMEVRKAIDDTRIEFGLSVEYLSAKEERFFRVGNTHVPVEDAYWTVPIELSGYFIIPFSTDVARLYIGGGGGVYTGERLYKVGNERADVVDKKLGWGIHIITGFEYSFQEWFGLRSEIKFRDLQFESTHAFSKSATTYNGVLVFLNQEPTRSRVNADGMLIDLGVVIRF